MEIQKMYAFYPQHKPPASCTSKHRGGLYQPIRIFGCAEDVVDGNVVKIGKADEEDGSLYINGLKWTRVEAESQSDT